MVRTELGNFIEKLRKEQGVSLRKMGRDLEVNSSFICAVEMGRRPAPDSLIKKIAEYFELSRDDKETLFSLAYDRKERIKFKNLNHVDKRIVYLFMKHIREIDQDFKETVLSDLENGKKTFKFAR